MESSEILNAEKNDKAEKWTAGVKRAVPIVVGYIPVGFAFGVLAQKAGLSAFNTMLMSLIVYGGASQFIAVGLLSAGVSPVSIVVTTFIVNLRHLIMASAISPYLRKWRTVELAAFTYELTDETFAIHSTTFLSGVPPKASIFAVNITAQASWLVGTWLGITTGKLIADVKPYALDYALAALFIALIVMQIRNKVQVIVAFLTGALATALLMAGLDQWNIIVAAVAGATLGVIIEQWIKKKSS